MEPKICALTLTLCPNYENSIYVYIYISAIVFLGDNIIGNSGVIVLSNHLELIPNLEELDLGQ